MTDSPPPREARSTPTPLTIQQRRALQWMADYESNYAGWKVNGRDPQKGDKPEDWNQMELRGPEGSIRILSDVWLSLGNMITGGDHAHRRIYMLTDEGRAALARVRP